MYNLAENRTRLPSVMRDKCSRALEVNRAFPAAPFLVLTCILACLSAPAQPTPVPLPGPAPTAPPPAPPVEVRSPAPAPKGPTESPKGLVLYSTGQPTDEEQLYLEYINRSRANPPVEGARLAATTDADVLAAYAAWNVNLTLMQSEFNTNPAVPPLAMNAQLLAAARWHSGDMFTNQYQGHYQTNNGIVTAPWDRMATNGYPWWTAGENVFASAKSVFYGHAGFNVDWGSGPGGMQDPPGHRQNIQSASYREVGVGVTDGTNGSVGPQLVTQDFARTSAGTPFLCGVVYYDVNGNGFYDIGEGIGGVTVNTPGSTYYAITADSGGYTLPVTTNGTYTISFSAAGLSTQKVVTVTSLKNVKVDFVPAYSAPVISGPNPAYLNVSNLYHFSAVGAATGYEWQQTVLGAYTAVEGAENGLANVTVVSSPGYSVLASDVRASGSYSFHLAQPDAANQFLTLNPILRPGAGSQLTFAKRLGWATSSQIAKAQVSTNGGGTWQDVWSQAGSNGSGELGFSTVNVSLSTYAAQNIQVRFAYLFPGGSYYPQTSAGVGLYLDDISVSDANQALSQATNNLPAGTQFSFCPSTNATYLLQVRARINSRLLGWGPGMTVGVTSVPPSLEMTGKPVLAGGQAQIDFTVANYPVSGMTFQLWKAPAPTGTWTQDTSATLTTLVANSKFRFTTVTGAAPRTFYRVQGSY